jgi:hypothetical protein
VSATGIVSQQFAAVGEPAGRPNPVEHLLQQASALAQQLQWERANLEGQSRADARPALQALEQQLAQLWSAIRVARLPGSLDTEALRRRPKWS